MESVVIEKEAMNLSPVEKALLADRLLQSLDMERNENARAWAKVAEKRLEEYHAGRMDAYDGQTIIDSLRNKT
jgi:putative addiction module component (TIGR02574 family)